MTDTHAAFAKPLEDLDELDEVRIARYGDKDHAKKIASDNKAPDAFRNYDPDEKPGVREFYRLNHKYQTVSFVKEKKREYLSLERRQMSIWEAMEYLNTLVDSSDPDTDLTQIEHLMQTAEAIRNDGHERWFILAGLIHDLGKVLCLFGEPQWAVVGDTFPVGCAYAPEIVYSEYLRDNADASVSEYQTECGVYSRNCGLDTVDLSWGHDEYLYQVVRNYLPDEALAMIRYHSFYPWHREGAYQHLLNAKDHSLLKSVQAFNPYDLYSKSAVRPDVEALRPYYEDLIGEYFPPVLNW